MLLELETIGAAARIIGRIKHEVMGRRLMNELETIGADVHREEHAGLVQWFSVVVCNVLSDTVIMVVQENRYWQVYELAS